MLGVNAQRSEIWVCDDEVYMPSTHLDGSLTDQTLKYKFCYEQETYDDSGTRLAWDWCQNNVSTLRDSIY